MEELKNQCSLCLAAWMAHEKDFRSYEAAWMNCRNWLHEGTMTVIQKLPTVPGYTEGL
jgi:hypothetical protein